MPESLSHLPTIALTMGDPAGIGPEIILKALADPEVAPLAHWIVVGDGRVLQMAEQFTGLKREGSELRNADTLGDLSGFGFGRMDARCGAAACAGASGSGLSFRFWPGRVWPAACVVGSATAPSVNRLT